MEQIVDVLREIADTLSEISSKLDGVSGKLNSAIGIYGIDDVIECLEKVSNNITGALGNNLSDIVSELFEIKTNIGRIE